MWLPENADVGENVKVEPESVTKVGPLKLIVTTSLSTSLVEGKL